MSVSRFVLIASFAGILTACGPDEKAEDGVSVAAASDRGASKTASAKKMRTPQTKKPVCPPEPEGGKTDIFGISAGDGYDRAAATLKCKYPNLAFETGAWHTDHTEKMFGVKTRQRLRVTDGDECSVQEKMSAQQGRGGRCGERWGGGRLKPRKSGSVTVNVVMTGLPKEEVVHGVWREQTFNKDARPALQVVEAKLIEKYGEPHATKKRTYDKKLFWVYDVLGRPMPKDNRDFDRCKDNVDPSFYRGQGWRTGCGLTIVAEVTESSDQPGMTRFLNVAFLDQNNFYEAQEQMEADLEAARATKAKENAEAAKSVSLDL
ncbi:MAG: hypothetical protein AAF720_14285 [Pseudomonadota bacterium]